VALTDVQNLGRRLLNQTNMRDTQAVSSLVKEFYDTRRTPASSINILCRLTHTQYHCVR